METTYSEKVYRRHPSVSFTRFGDEMLVVVPKLSWQLVLNGTGARIFELLDGTRTVGQIAGELGAEFAGAPVDEVARDVQEVLADLTEKGAVEPLG